MSDHDALLAAICANPRDDTPPLVFADWLEENGQAERAAFIRTDIAMSHRDEWDSERLKWEENCDERFANDRGRSGSLPKSLFPPLLGSLEWLNGPATRRGFPRGISVAHHRTLFGVAADVFAMCPIETVSFWDVPRVPDKFVKAPWFARLTGLEFGSGRPPLDVLMALLKTPTELRELSLGGRTVDARRLEAVFSSHLAANIRRLAIHRDEAALGQVVLDALAHWPPNHRLRTLELPGGVVTANAYQVAERIPPGLTSLGLPMSRMNSERAAAFAARGGLAGLKCLELASNPVGNAGAAAIFTSPNLAGLKVLDLSYCQVGDEALRALLDDSPLAEGLNLLNLTGSPASAEMKQAVKDRMGDRVRL